MAEQDGVPVRIVGRKDWLYTEHRRFSAAELMPGGPDGIYTLWLDHEPRELRDAAAAGADLALCGHTHGGQIFMLGQLMAGHSEDGVYRSGWYAPTRSTSVMVSNGAGTVGLPFRLGVPPQLHVITLKSQP